MKKTGVLIIFLILLSVSSANSQVLIGLLFGDKLNSPKTEFGLNGIYNTNTLSDISDPKNYRSYGFGLYLDYKISDNEFGENRKYLKWECVPQNGIDSKNIDVLEYAQEETVKLKEELKDRVDNLGI